MVNDYIKEFRYIFSEAEFNALPERRPWDHVTELTPGFKPLNCKVYPLNGPEQKALDAFLEENLRTGDALNRREQERKPTQNQHKPTAWIVQRYREIGMCL